MTNRLRKGMENRRPTIPKMLIKELPRDTEIIEVFKKINADPLPAR